MRKFKHIETGYIATPLETITNIYKFDCGEAVEYPIHLSLLEGSDWEEIKKTKIPLFTTEDGVDIFEGDTIFGINNDWKVFSHYTDLQNKVKSWGIKPIFSTEKNAEKYIQLNKPQYSIKDIVPIVHNWAMSPCIDENDILNFLAKNENTKN